MRNVRKKIKQDRVTFAILNKLTDSVGEKTFDFDTHFTTPEKALKAGKKCLDSNEFEVYGIKEVVTTETVYKMSESDFIKYAEKEEN